VKLNIYYFKVIDANGQNKKKMKKKKKGAGQSKVVEGVSEQ
jgi:hypothetical protein